MAKTGTSFFTMPISPTPNSTSKTEEILHVFNPTSFSLVDKSDTEITLISIQPILPEQCRCLILVIVNF